MTTSEPVSEAAALVARVRSFVDAVKDIPGVTVGPVRVSWHAPEHSTCAESAEGCTVCDEICRAAADERELIVGQLRGIRDYLAGALTSEHANFRIVAEGVQSKLADLLDPPTTERFDADPPHTHATDEDADTCPICFPEAGPAATGGTDG